MRSILCRLPLKEERTIRFRSNAASLSRELVELFETGNSTVLYAILAKGTGRPNDACIVHYRLQDHLEDSSYSQSSPFYGEIRYRITRSDTGLRVCYKLWFSEDEDKNGQICLIPHVFAVITNIAEKTWTR